MNTETNKLAEVHGNILFLEFLKEPTKRFSRFEAYIYLLNKACARYRPENIASKFLPEIGEGQFFTTVSEIAEDLGANRATVRDFLSKLESHGHLMMEKSLKGMLCTMTHLSIPATPSVAISHSFDTMARHTMHAWGRGEISAEDVADVAGQLTRSASIMLRNTSVAGYAHKQLSAIHRLLCHYALEAAVASLPRMTSLSQTLKDKTAKVDDCLVELLENHLAGSWTALLALLTDRTDLTLEGLVLAVEEDEPEDRKSIWESLREDAILVTGLDLPLSPSPSSPTETAAKMVSSEDDDDSDSSDKVAVHTLSEED